jgi:primosomal protein N' (replication factor Y)
MTGRCDIVKYAFIRVSVPHKSVDRDFHYIIPPELKDKLSVGMRVYVPFGNGNRRTEGYILGFADKSDVEEDRLKSILAIHEDYSVLSDRRISLASWMSEQYYSTFNECLHTVAPKAVNQKTFACLSLNRDNPELSELVEKVKKRGGKQSRVLDLFRNEGTEIPKSHIKSILDIDTSPIDALVKKGILKTTHHRTYRGNFYGREMSNDKPPLTEEQSTVIEKIMSETRPVLIHGVTGSGKTEVYLRLIEDVISRGKQAIVLVPEISLTPQTVERFVGRFGDRVSLTHSAMSNGERYDQWTRAARGEIDIMIGPRSAVFTPFEKLGIIIIDEEHETSYKADCSPRYDAREVALKLGELYGARVVLGSATPSVVSYYKSVTGEYALAEMKHRVNRTMPDIEICDMRRELATGNYSVFSRDLKAAMEENLQKGKQTIIFLNRRGYSTFVSCRSCGYVMSCDRCNVNYTYHKGSNSLVCHYCGKSVHIPDKCPECGSKYIKYFGTGTEKLEQEILRIFPQARVLRMDRDTTSRKNSHADILDAFRKGEADILLGTQMIAKGLDFPNVTLVGVVAADLSLNMNDYRSGEITYSLLTQVAGRAGRADEPGRVYIQTYNPQHYAVTCVKYNDYLTYFNEEISFRKIMSYPPFSNVFYVLISSEDERRTIDAANLMAAIMTRYNKNNMFERLGPVPAVISKINNKYRYRILIKCADEKKIKAYVCYCVDVFSKKKGIGGVSVSIALNPSYTI